LIAVRVALTAVGVASTAVGIASTAVRVPLIEIRVASTVSTSPAPTKVSEGVVAGPPAK
jgi:hypothetical protein